MDGWVRMKTLRISLLFIFTLVPLAAHAQTTYLCSDNGKAFKELRIYDINRANRIAFHERFADHALRLMKKYGFTVDDMWESDAGEKLQFVYIISWPDKETMESRWKAFRADKEWDEVKKRSVEKHGELLTAIQTQTMVRVSYSPACSSKK